MPTLHGWVWRCCQGRITGSGRGCVPTPCVNLSVSAPTPGCSWPTRAAHGGTRGFFSYQCCVSLRPVAAPRQVCGSVSHHVLPLKMERGALTSRGEVPASCPLAVGSATILSPVRQLLPGYSHRRGHCAFPTPGVLMRVPSPVLSKEPARAL